MAGSEPVRIARAQWLQTFGLALLATGFILLVLGWNLMGTAAQIAASQPRTTANTITNSSSSGLVTDFINSSASEVLDGMVLAVVGIIITVVSWFMIPK